MDDKTIDILVNGLKTMSYSDMKSKPDVLTSKQRMEDCRNTIMYQTGFDLIFGQKQIMCIHPKVGKENACCLTCKYFEKKK